MISIRSISLCIILPLMIACSSTTPSSPQKTTNSHDTLQLPNGDLYTGDILQGQAHGNGKLTYKDGSEYIGTFKNNVPDGFGISNNADGSRYEGEHKKGLFEGRGKLTLSNGAYFIGSFRNNKAFRGIMTFPDGKQIKL